MGAASRILTDGFFADKTNFVTYQMERLKTFLSLESTYPRINNQYKKFFHDSFNGTPKKTITNGQQQQQFMLISGLEKNGKVIGFAEIDARPPKLDINAPPSSNPPTGPPAPRPYMYNLAVDKKFKRRGIASSLIKSCEDVCVNYWGYDCMYLKVRRGNKGALHLYRGLGYEEIPFPNVDPEGRSSSTTEQINLQGDDEVILMAKKLYPSAPQ